VKVINPLATANVDVALPVTRGTTDVQIVLPDYDNGTLNASASASP
jgi:hypothetical protein